MASLRRLACTLLGLLFLACQTPRMVRSTPGSAGGPERRDQVELHDTLPSFLASLRRKRTPIPAGPMSAWGAYEKAEQPLLAAAGALVPDPGDARLTKLASNPESVIELVQAFEERAPDELSALVDQVAEKTGAAPGLAVGFAVSRGDRTWYAGQLEGRPLVLLNARHPELAKPPARKTILARALFRSAHRTQVPDSASLGPLASLAFREGACLLAARQLVPDAFEQQTLGLSDEQLDKLRGREQLIAQEMLAGFDSARESEAARFFDPDVKDPLLPQGSGPFIADRIYQRLTAELSSADKPLQLTPDEFARRARRILATMSGAP